MLKQQLQFKLSQKLSPQQIQLMRLIQLPLQSLEQQVLREIEENPALASGKETDVEQEEFDLPEQDTGEIIDTNDIDIDKLVIDQNLKFYCDTMDSLHFYLFHLYHVSLRM